jgi:hypothetical protein
MDKAHRKNQGSPWLGPGAIVQGLKTRISAFEVLVQIAQNREVAVGISILIAISMRQKMPPGTVAYELGTFACVEAATPYLLHGRGYKAEDLTLELIVDCRRLASRQAPGRSHTDVNRASVVNSDLGREPSVEGLDLGHDRTTPALVIEPQGENTMRLSPI